MVTKIASIVVERCFVFDHVAMIDEFLSINCALVMIAHMFVVSCFMLTQVITIAENLSTLITFVNLTAMSSGVGSLRILAKFLPGVGEQRRGALKRPS